MLRTELAIGDQLITIPGENVARMKVELSLAETDSLAEDTLAAVGSILRADYVVLGSYLVLPGAPDGGMRFDWRVQDTRDGAIVRADQESGTESDIFDLVAGAGSKLRETLDFRPLNSEELAEVRASLPAVRNAARLYSAGLEKLRVFDAVGARELLEQASAADPTHPLIRSALSAAWSDLGYDARALAEARLAADLSSGLPRQERLTVEGRLHELNGEWGEAITIYQGLFLVFPDDLDNGLRLAAAQVSAGEAENALTTVNALRQLPPPASADPRIDLAEADAAKVLTDFERQRQAAASAGQLAEARGARVLFAAARLSECESLVNLLRAEEARSACAEARDVFREIGNGSGVARADYLVAVSHAKSGDLESAGTVFDRALSEARRIGNRREIVKLLTNVGNVLSAQGRFDEAKKAFMEALDVSEEIADKRGTAVAWNAVAVTLEEEGHLDEAVETYQRALDIFRAIGSTRWVAIVHYNIGCVRQLQDRPDLARGEYERSVDVNRQLGMDIDGAESLVALGEVLIELGKTEEAWAVLAEAMQWYVDAADAEGEAAVRETLERLDSTRTNGP
jgi:tetratricopeptide (TPR) repeat protein